MSRWSVGEAEAEALLAERALQSVTGSAADGIPGLARARQTLASAQVLLDADPTNALVLAYDAARQGLHRPARPARTTPHHDRRAYRR